MRTSSPRRTATGVAVTDETRVTRQRKSSAAVERASSSVMPRVDAAYDVPPGPERNRLLADAVAAALDIAAGRQVELIAEVTRLRGELANAAQKTALLEFENARLRDERASSSRGWR